MKPKKLAALVTEYRKWSHADVIVGKILEGDLYDGKLRGNLQLASLYVDQFPETDLSQALAKKYQFPIARTIEQALTAGGKTLAVEGVLIIGEHGKYPENERGQKLYPRKRFFDEVVAVFEKTGQTCPVFNDKHLSVTWADAEAMVRTARKRMFPLMAGSSIPVTWRKPDLAITPGSTLTAALQLGYGPLEGYGFHALEGLQCMLERRKGGETGVRAVTCLQGKAMWPALDSLPNSEALITAALERVPARAKGDYRTLSEKDPSSAVFWIEYQDGLKAAVAMLNGALYEGDGGAFVFAGQLLGEKKPLATHFYLQQPDPFAHFAELLKAIESMMLTGHPAYPVERTLLTTGILEAVMLSKHKGNKQILTPHLENLTYTPSKWSHAQGEIPKPIPRWGKK
jgi:hypothetical protein